MKFLLTIIISYTISYILIPIFGKIAYKLGFLDQPTKRKAHEKPIPLLGSVGIFIAFFVSYFSMNPQINNKNAIILISSLLIIMIGIIDDWYKTKSIEFPVLPRLLTYIFCASMIYMCEIKVNGINFMGSIGYVMFPEVVSYVLTVLWIVGLIVVINWVDGLDGLAGGISAIATMTFYILAIVKKQPISAFMSSAMIGSILGYLRYNMPPARIYMGDSGATFIGFMISIISLDSAFKQATVITIFIPILALGVPIFDNLRVVIKRKMMGNSIYKADRLQMHNQLKDKGIDGKLINLIIYLASACLNLLAIIIFLLTS